jgi:hypothetical protein
MVLRIDSEHQGLYVFMSSPDSGCPYSGYPGTTFIQSSSTGGVAFPDGRGTPATTDILSPNLDNATTTKQSVSSATGMVVTASNDTTRRYWYADLPLGSS